MSTSINKYCIDTGAPRTWTSFCGKWSEEPARALPILTLDTYLWGGANNQGGTEIGGTEIDWCEECENDPRLHLVILDNLKL